MEMEFGFGNGVFVLLYSITIDKPKSQCYNK